MCCENDRIAVRKRSAANLFSSIFNLAYATGGGGGGGSLPTPPLVGSTSADSWSQSSVDLAAEGVGTLIRQTVVADKGDMFLLRPPQRLSHSQSVRSKPGPTRSSARAALLGSTVCGTSDTLPVGLAGFHRHRRSRSFVDFERALRSF